MQTKYDSPEQEIIALRKAILQGLRALGRDATRLEDCAALDEEILQALTAMEHRHRQELEKMAVHMRAQEHALCLVRDTLRCGEKGGWVEGWEQRHANYIDQLLQCIDFDDGNFAAYGEEKSHV